ncbi:MAG: hypothetical protein A2583_09750 [Bdellovibrionales bacterium RIFOXYD1_FULL_53_11]|nr:MAG: hypothetical protein A2583_09750 [Bdellovibrionales bacterium RIFOXYD1_FULL_53_11]
MAEMKKLAVLCLCLALAPGCKKKFESYGVSIELESRSLPNGLRVIMIEDHTMPVISYQTWFRVGSVDEKPGHTGISHLVEHMMFKGTPKYPAKQLFQVLEARGANINAFTTRDYTAFHEEFTPDLLPKVIELEADRMANLAIEEDALKTEQMIVFEEHRLHTENSPVGKIQEALWALAFRTHPYRWPVIGIPGEASRIPREKVQEWLKKYYIPANAVIVACGDLKPDKTMELIEKYYGPVPGGSRSKREIAPEAAQNEERRLIMRAKVASERLSEAYHITSADNDESYAIDVLANIMFEGTSSRAYRRLVDEKNIAISVSGSSFTPAHPGLFMITATMNSSIPAAAAETELDLIIKELQEKPVSHEEIAAAVKQLTLQIVDGIRTPHGLAQLIGTVTAIFDDPERFSEDIIKYTKVTPGDVQQAAQKYLIPNNRVVVTLVPEAKIK